MPPSRTLLSLVVGCALTCLGQTGVRIGQIQKVPLVETATAEAAPHATFETWVEGIGKSHMESILAVSARISREHGKLTVSRAIRDNFRNLQVGYLVTIAARERGGYLVSIDVTKGPEAPNAKWKVAAPPSGPAVQILQNGEAVGLELFAEESGRRLVEYVRVGSGPLAERGQPPREIYTDDAEFSILHGRLRVNGSAIQVADVSEAVHGTLLHVEIPGHGRFTLAFKPRTQEFERLGEVSGASLIFQAGSDLFRLDCAERIADSGSGTYFVYGIKEPATGSTTVRFSASEPRPPLNSPGSLATTGGALVQH